MTNLNNSIEKPKFPSEDFEDSQFGYDRYEDSSYGEDGNYTRDRHDEINHGVEESEGEDEI